MKKIVLCLLALALVQSNLVAQNKLANLKSSFSEYRVSTINCAKIIHHSGSLIYIPSKAFEVDVNKVDSVSLLYREIRTPVQTAINGYRMTTELMGKTYQLESNGMFEIYCLNGSDTIQVHEDRSIVVRLAMERNEVDVMMEGYKYNSETNHWDSYTNRIQNLLLTEQDDDLWGSSIVETQSEAEVFEPGWDDEWFVDPAWARKDSLRQVAFQTMEIFDFGLYNYDKIITDEVFVPYVPEFVNGDNEPIKSEVYVIYKDLNTVIYFNEYNWKDDFTLIKDREYAMFTIGEEGEIFKLNDYPTLGEPESELTFKLELEGPVPNEANELSNLIGMR
ncbi:hypothetical protein [Fulvivirga lutea]|uniref:DUF4412 domain-containing protein n=1 Tax=Fulvivirga lutea TaxID=2810512 RepID=A0A974WFU5_9BACT|nr:hypothetical protein [Fulvivirga lutea]QSE97245.1 hypothetical protein JR347_16890 [Fulvivirga lutea]